MTDAATRAIALLRAPATIRARCEQVFEAGCRGTLRHFALDVDRLPVAVEYVRDVTLASYPAFDIPFHSRWRHFQVGGRDRWTDLAPAATDPIETARCRFDLAVTSVLLDAGAGSTWRYRAADGQLFARSEGLAVASLELFAAGAFSATAGSPLRAEAAALAGMSAEQLARGMQVRDDNQLVGLEARSAMLRRLGQTLSARPDLFGQASPRIGNLVDVILRHSEHRSIAADHLLRVVLDAFAAIWPTRLTIAGTNLGDVGRHHAVVGEGPDAGLVPFHKLSQWLTYSLIEPIEQAGVRVVALDTLTGLPEYRNGGLFIDLGVLRPLFRTDAPLDPLSEPIVEWRALTVALLDRLAAGLRRRQGLTDAQLPLAKVLQGGTWAAGRKIAAALRPDGRPPIDVASDGTLF